MITEIDVIEAWKYWHKAGLTPPDIKNKKEFRTCILNMHRYLKHTNQNKFNEAVLLLGKSTRWPTFFDIQQVLKKIS